jgi:hypothetical protein
MTEAECEQAFEVVSGAMQAAGLNWVVTQVAEQIRFGKPSTKRIQTTVEHSPEIAVEGVAGRPKRTRETFAFTREYTASERLSLLLDALERAVVLTSQMEAVVRGQLFGKTNGLNSIRLIRTDEPGRDVLEVGAGADPVREKAVQTLYQLVAGLRGRI